MPQDLVLVNPPFWPAEGAQLYQFGGSDGESVTRRAVKGTLPVLVDGGLLLVVSPIFNEWQVLDRLLSWGVKIQAHGALVIISKPMGSDDLVHEGGYSALPQSQLASV